MYKFFRTLHCVILEKMGGKKLVTMSRGCDVVSTLQRCVALKIVVANRLVYHHLYFLDDVDRQSGYAFHCMSRRSSCWL